MIFEAFGAVVYTSLSCQNTQMFNVPKYWGYVVDDFMYMSVVFVGQSFDSVEMFHIIINSEF